jgi:hypothetical protein
MASAYASCIIEAPVEAVWAAVRDFNALPAWNPAVADSRIEDGLDSDVVGCVRAFHIGDQLVRERLLSLDDSCYRFSYNFETPAFPVANYLATFELIPCTDRDTTFAHWHAAFDERPEDAGRYVRIISEDVFAGGLRALAAHVRGRAAPPSGPRWQGLRPAKVFCSAVIGGTVEDVWARIRDFAGMGAWHPDITAMAMRDDARSDRVSGVREFRFGEGRLAEQLTLLCDRTHSFRYRIIHSETAWLNYHAGVRLYRVTDTAATFAVWTADWVAAPADDVTLIPMVHHQVFQTAFDTLNIRFFRRSAGGAEQTGG